MFSSIGSKPCDPFLQIRQFSSFQHGDQILCTEFIFRIGSGSGCSHCHNGYRLRIFLSDILHNGFGIDQTSGDHLTGTFCIDNALGSGTGGVDDGFAGHKVPIHAGRGIAIVKSLTFFTAALTHQNTVRDDLVQSECILDGAHRTDGFYIHIMEITLQRKGAEYIDDHSQTFCLFRAFDHMQMLNLHTLTLISSKGNP